MEEGLRLNRCKKFQNMICPHIEEPEMERVKLREHSEGFDPIGYWEDLKKGNDKFCIGCTQFEE